MSILKEKFYITTTLPYVNADPHVGFALEIIQADALARYKRMMGADVFFNTGTDEHGLKIYRKAVESEKEPQKYVDEYAVKFENLKKALNLSYDNFIRTTNAKHIEAAQVFWIKCQEAGDIYKKNYKVKYCVGCELEKTESELVNECCPVHPNLKLEIIEEENYFFRWSKYQEKLIKFYNENPNFVIPDSRFNEIKNFVKNGLEDFSISRLVKKMPWGVPVPGDKDHVMYVWFDALVNYISAIGWPHDMERFGRYWPVVQLAGKDNLRQQSAMWQAMLMSAGLPMSKQIVIHGYITSGGQKMSKSLGNVINPYDVVAKYGADALRFYLLREITFEDGDFTYERFEEVYAADLQNGLGNFISRTLTMIEKYFEGKIPVCGKEASLPGEPSRSVNDFVFSQTEKIVGFMDKYELNKVLSEVVNKNVTVLDGYIDYYKPFKLIKEDQEKTATVLYNCAESIRIIAWSIRPFMPETSDKIFAQLFADEKERAEELKKTLEEAQKWGGLKPGTKIKKGAVLFPRLAK